jgi:DNA-binding GntR family transcriptional regulator
MKAHMDRVCNLTLHAEAGQHKLLDQHRAIAEAIDAHDADAAETVMRQHLQEILAGLPAVEAQYPELFE